MTKCCENCRCKQLMLANKLLKDELNEETARVRTLEAHLATHRRKATALRAELAEAREAAARLSNTKNRLRFLPRKQNNAE